MSCLLALSDSAIVTTVFVFVFVFVSVSVLVVVFVAELEKSSAIVAATIIVVLWTEVLKRVMIVVEEQNLLAMKKAMPRTALTSANIVTAPLVATVIH
jgi:hypothetical protein